MQLLDDIKCVNDSLGQKCRRFVSLRKSTKKRASSQNSQQGPPQTAITQGQANGGVPFGPSPDIVNVTIHRGSGGIGLSIVSAEAADTHEIGIYVKKVIEGSAAEKNGQIMFGDQLLSVNGQSLKGMTQENAAQMLAKSGPVVQMTVAKQAAVFNGVASYLMQGSAPPVMTRNSPVNGVMNSSQPNGMLDRFRSEEYLTASQQQAGQQQHHPAFINGRPASGNPLLYTGTSPSIPHAQPVATAAMHHRSNPAIVGEAQRYFNHDGSYQVNAYQDHSQQGPRSLSGTTNGYPGYHPPPASNRSASSIPAMVMNHQPGPGYPVNGPNSARSPPPYNGRTTPTSMMNQSNPPAPDHSRSLSASNLREPSRRHPGVLGPQVLPTNGGPPPVFPKRVQPHGSLPRAVEGGASYYHPDTIQRQHRASVGELDHRVQSEPQYHNIGAYRVSGGSSIASDASGRQQQPQPYVGQHATMPNGMQPAARPPSVTQHQQPPSYATHSGQRSYSPSQNYNTGANGQMIDRSLSGGAPATQGSNPRGNYTPVWMGATSGTTANRPVVVAAAPHARSPSHPGPNARQQQPPYSPIWVGSGYQQQTAGSDIDHRATPSLTGSSVSRNSPLPHATGPSTHPQQRYAVLPTEPHHNRPYSPRTHDIADLNSSIDSGRLVRARSHNPLSAPVVSAAASSPANQNGSLQHHTHLNGHSSSDAGRMMFSPSSNQPRMGQTQRPTSLGTPLYTSSPVLEDPLGNYQNIANYPVHTDSSLPSQHALANGGSYMPPAGHPVGTHFKFPPPQVPPKTAQPPQPPPMVNGYHHHGTLDHRTNGAPPPPYVGHVDSPGIALLARATAGVAPVPYMPKPSDSDLYDDGDEEERIKKSIMDEVYQTLEEELEVLESKGYRTQQENERLSALKLEVEFRKRLRCAEEDIDDEPSSPQKNGSSTLERMARQEAAFNRAEQSYQQDAWAQREAQFRSKPAMAPRATMDQGLEETLIDDVDRDASAAIDDGEEISRHESMHSGRQPSPPSHSQATASPVASLPQSPPPSSVAEHQRSGSQESSSNTFQQQPQLNRYASDKPTPKVIGAQEVYRDPRENRLRQQQHPIDKPEGEKLSFKEKMRLFAQEAGEDTPKSRTKSSSAQRDIETHLLK